VHSKFSCVRSSHGLCARAQLRGNIGPGSGIACLGLLNNPEQILQTGSKFRVTNVCVIGAINKYQYIK